MKILYWQYECGCIDDSDIDIFLKIDGYDAVVAETLASINLNPEREKHEVRLYALSEEVAKQLEFFLVSFNPERLSGVGDEIIETRISADVGLELLLLTALLKSQYKVDFWENREYRQSRSHSKYIYML